MCVVACAYLEGDRIVTCAIKQQYSQTRRVFDLNAADVGHTRYATGMRPAGMSSHNSQALVCQFILKHT